MWCDEHGFLLAKDLYYEAWCRIADPCFGANQRRMLLEHVDDGIDSWLIHRVQTSNYVPRCSRRTFPVRRGPIALAAIKLMDNAYEIDFSSAIAYARWQKRVANAAFRGDWLELAILAVHIDPALRPESLNRELRRAEA